RPDSPRHRPQPLPTHRRRPRLRHLLHQGPQPGAPAAHGRGATDTTTPPSRATHHRPTHHRPPRRRAPHATTPHPPASPTHDYLRRLPDTLDKCQSPSDQGSLVVVRCPRTL